MLMFFNFPPQRACFAYTKDVFRRAHNSPSLSLINTAPTLTESHFSGQMQSFLVWWTHWCIEIHSRTRKQDPAYVKTLAKKNSAQTHTLVLILTAGCPSECEQVDLITGYDVYTHTHTHSQKGLSVSKCVATNLLFSFLCSLFLSLLL